MKKINKGIVLFLIGASIVLFSLFHRYEPGRIVNGYTNFGNTEYKQLELPEIGEEIAVIKTTLGEIKIRLFPEIAPISVKNFKNLVKNKFYDGLAFDIVENNFLIQIRKNTAKSYYARIHGGHFERKIDEEYYHFTGAVGFVADSQGKYGTDFYIICNDGIEPAYLELLSRLGEEDYSPGLIRTYKQFGGAPELDYNNMIFGQVFYGMDTVFEIGKQWNIIDTTTGYSLAVQSVVIDTIEIVPYEGK